MKSENANKHLYILTEDINNAINKIIKIFKQFTFPVSVQQNYIKNFHEKDLNWYLGDLKIRISALCKTILSYLFFVGLNEKNLKNIRKNTSLLVKHINQICFYKTNRKHSNIVTSTFKCNELLSILKQLSTSKISLLCTLGKMWIHNVNKKDLEENTNIIFTKYFKNLVFCSEKFKEQFVQNIEEFDMANIVFKNAMTHNILPKGSLSSEDKKAFFIASNIVRRFIKSTIDESNGSYIDLLVNRLQVCSSSEGLNLFSEGSVSKCFIKIVESMRMLIVNQVTKSFLYKNNEKLSSFTSCFIQDFILSEWDLFHDEQIVKIYSKCKDILISETVRSKTSKKKNISKILLKIDLTVSNSCASKTKLFVVDAFNAINKKQSNGFDYLQLGLKASPYKEIIQIGRSSVAFIHNFYPYFQQSPTLAEIAPEFFWFLQNQNKRHVAVLLESKEIWHHKERSKIFTKIHCEIENPSFTLLTLFMDTPKYIYTNYTHKTAKSHIESLNISYILSKANITKDRSIKIENWILQNIPMILKRKKVNESLLMFVTDFIYGLLTILTLRMHDAMSLSIVESNSFEMSSSLNVFVKCVSMLLATISEKRDTQEIVMSIFDLYIIEAFIRPLSIDGEQIGVYHLKRIQNFIQHFASINTKYKFIDWTFILEFY